VLIIRTPLRVSLLGGGTDYPDFINSHGCGHVIGGAIDKYIYLMSVPIIKGIHKFSLGFHYSKIEKVTNADDLNFTPIKLAIKKHKLQEQFEYHLVADLPAMSGLGSSSAFAASVMKTISEQNNLDWNTIQLYNESVNFERNTLEETVGYQDQYFATNGGFLDVTWNKSGEIIKEIFDVEKAYFISENSILINTGQSRQASGVAKEQIDELPNNIETLKKILEISLQGKQAIDDMDIKKIGAKINESWNLKRSLSHNVSNSEINSMITRVLELGAVGAKLLGAGAGGFIYCLGEPKVLNLIRKEFKSYGTTNFGFTTKGTEKFML
jgi:D-glycero-alpha-D-manno-heptose-7-phosphate kinase